MIIPNLADLIDSFERHDGITLDQLVTELDDLHRTALRALEAVPTTATATRVELSAKTDAYKYALALARKVAP